MKINKNTRLRFAKEPKETGLRAVGNPYSSTIIKINGLCVGYIIPPSWNSKHESWIVRLMVEDGEDWKWIQFKQQFEFESDAREFIIANIDAILLKYKLHQMKD